MYIKSKMLFIITIKITRSHNDIYLYHSGIWCNKSRIVPNSSFGNHITFVIYCWYFYMHVPFRSKYNWLICLWKKCNGHKRIELKNSDAWYRCLFSFRRHFKLCFDFLHMLNTSSATLSSTIVTLHPPPLTPSSLCVYNHFFLRFFFFKQFCVYHVWL